ncbi:elongation factor Ts%2C mitochondrial [Scomber scombrus]|uniref:Elongation factor Ts, mitochondrial n=1 Tax=Scomber scombrus TaxID=13677 RepID=A0AAV1NA23_SCOSC
MSLTFLFRTLTRDVAKVSSLNLQHVQSLHIGSQLLAAEKALLMKLRKSTGYTFINCKKALEKFDNDITQTSLAADELNKLSVGEGPSLADQLALTIGRLGENMSLKRAVTVGIPAEWHIGSYVHGGVSGQTEVAMGRYGALVVFQGGKQGEQETLGRKLGQHIVGEAPVSLGNMDDLPCGESETRLLPQTFLGDPSRTVAQFLRGQQARVLDFVRFQCGETASDAAE